MRVAPYPQPLLPTPHILQPRPRLRPQSPTETRSNWLKRAQTRSPRPTPLDGLAVRAPLGRTCQRHECDPYHQ